MNSTAIQPQPQIPCLLTQSQIKDLKKAEREGALELCDTKTKVIFVVSAVLAAIGVVLLAVLPPVGGAAIAALFTGGAGLGLISAAILMCISNRGSYLDKIEKLEAAQKLAVGLEISEALQKELEAIIPHIDAIKDDARLASVRYNCNETATVILRSAPGLQFRVSPAAPNSPLGYSLKHFYENAVYAKAICDQENYYALLVPSIKPIYLKVGGLWRALLVEQVVQKDSSPNQDLKEAVRQMVHFLVKTGGPGLSSHPVSFVPVNGQLALQDLHHLTETSHPEPEVREGLEVNCIIDEDSSLLASLDREDLIDTALDELKKVANRKGRDRQIQRAKDARLNQIRNPVPEAARPAPVSPPNLLGVTPEDLGLDLSLRDYAFMKKSLAYSDGTCRIITLEEVAQVVLARINQKLADQPTNPNIEFTPQDMLIGADLPSFSWKGRYQYNTLQGLGYRGWPKPKQEPPYWINLIIQALKNKGLITSFEPQTYILESPKLTVNLSKLVRQQRSA